MQARVSHAGMVNTFLMANGLPIYATGSGYAGDDYVSDVRKERDGRLWLFLKEPGTDQRALSFFRRNACHPG